MHLKIVSHKRSSSSVDGGDAVAAGGPTVGRCEAACDAVDPREVGALRDRVDMIGRVSDAPTHNASSLSRSGTFTQLQIFHPSVSQTRVIT